jgi:hypothetical protein
VQYITERELCGSKVFDVYWEVVKELWECESYIRETTINLFWGITRGRVQLTCRHLIANTLDHTKEGQ